MSFYTNFIVDIEDSMKKKILFVIESLGIGGAEKSLTTLLNLIDYQKYDVDLQLFSYGQMFQKYVPEEVNLLEPIPFYEFCKNSMIGGIRDNSYSINQRIEMTIARASYSFELRKHNHSNPEKAVEFWKRVHKCIPKKNYEYDVAIAYAQGTPTFYVADCINSKKKIAWVNSNYKPLGKYKDYVEYYYHDYFDVIVGVSDTTSYDLKQHFSSVSSKITTVYDINDAILICKLADELNPLPDEVNYDGIKLVTVGRMCMNKGYDLAVQSGRILKDKGLNFRWYIVGDGSIRSELEELITKLDVGDRMILLGQKPNPYPYMKAADVYVQTSKFEGFCLTLKEARILNKPCVTTEFECVYDQMIQEKNGLVVAIDPQAIADGIERMINDKELRNSIVEYVKTEKKGNIEELGKIYQLLD